VKRREECKVRWGEMKRGQKRKEMWRELTREERSKVERRVDVRDWFNRWQTKQYLTIKEKKIDQK
jgi:hypothetical protein